jgi:hypothetical protein
MILNTTLPLIGKPVPTIDMLTHAGYLIATSGQETWISIRPSREARRTSWEEVIQLRHHPGRQISVFAESLAEALGVLAYEFHLWEVRESFRSVESLS